MKMRIKSALCFAAMCLAFGLSVPNVRAFSLLGPFEPWMQETNGFRQQGEFGGPMNLGNEYRWNVPVVTYSFDQSFLDYFGTNGVAAVESAIQILNDLPPASQLDPSNYPPDTTGINYAAQAGKLIDLKSETLFLLLQQFGLAAPDGFTFCLQSYSFTNDNIMGNVIIRNFDPITYLASSNVNDTLLDYYLFEYNPGQGFWTAAPFPVDSLAPVDSAVADGNVEKGYFFTGLTRDDVGGLRYLLQTNNYNFETLLPDVHGAGTDPSNYVNLALRGGVEKITFVRETVDPITGEFVSPVTNQYTETYVTNNVLMQQQLERVTTRPDFLFCAADFGNSNSPLFALSSSTGITNWINNAALNGNPGGAGPGMIQPPVKITFDKIGGQFVTSSGGDEIVFDQSQFYGSFDGSTNNPIVYPISQTGSVPMTVRMWLTMRQSSNQSMHSYEWITNSPIGSVFTMQTSTNLINWTTIFLITNNGTISTFLNNPSSPSRFYRLVPQ